MPDYVKPYIERIETFAKARGESVELLYRETLRHYYLKRNSSI